MDMPYPCVRSYKRKRPMGTKHAPQAPTRSETKAESTHAAVKAIIDKETAAREAKTKRLRAARLAREASDPAEKTAAPKPKTTKRTKR